MMIPNLLVFLTSEHGRHEWLLAMIRSEAGLYSQLFLFLLVPWVVVECYRESAQSPENSSDKQQSKMQYEDIEVAQYERTGDLAYRLKASRLELLEKNRFSVQNPVIFTGFGSASGSSLDHPMRISADRALLMNDQVTFYDHVMMQLDRCGALESSACNNTLTIQSSQLDYDIKKQFFVATGDTVMQQGFQSISARRISGNISDQDFTFDQAVITSRKPNQDTA